MTRGYLRSMRVYSFALLLKPRRYYFECYKGSNKLHFFRAEDAVASRVWMSDPNSLLHHHHHHHPPSILNLCSRSKLVAAGLTRGPSLDQANVSPVPPNVTTVLRI
jgi:hypothetical protein